MLRSAAALGAYEQKERRGHANASTGAPNEPRPAATAGVRLDPTRKNAAKMLASFACLRSRLCLVNPITCSAPLILYETP
jgi:hypothetical protein